MTLAIKVVKIDSEIIISLPWSKSVKQTVAQNSAQFHIQALCCYDVLYEPQKAVYVNFVS